MATGWSAGDFRWPTVQARTDPGDFGELCVPRIPPARASRRSRSADERGRVAPEDGLRRFRGDEGWAEGGALLARLPLPRGAGVAGLGRGEGAQPVGACDRHAVVVFPLVDDARCRTATHGEHG